MKKTHKRCPNGAYILEEKTVKNKQHITCQLEKDIAEKGTKEW